MNTSLPPTVRADIIRPLRTHVRILKILKSGKSGFRRFRQVAAMLAIALLFAQTANAATYYITGSGTSFSASKASAGGAAIANGSNVAIQAAIDAIRTDAEGMATTIQFGNGTTVLDIGTAYINFNGSTSLTPVWGAITLAGKITSSYSDITTWTTGAIYLRNGVSITSTADIANTGLYTPAVYRNSTGTVNISGGTVSSETGSAVENRSSGTVNISGGTVSSEDANAVASSNGKITVSGTAKITSASTDVEYGGTIYLQSGGTLEITGGTVENTAANANARAIYNIGIGTVSISGGTVSATATGRSIHNESTGTVIITGGTISNTGNNKYYNNNSGGTIIEWTNPSVKTYTAFTSTNITKLPATATAQWLNKNGSGGIDYTNGANMGFAAVSGVTVNKIAVTPAPTFPTTAAITYNPATTLSAVPFVGGTGAGAFAWQTPATTPTVAVSSYPVVFTPTDADNYNTVNQNVTLTVSKAAGTFATTSALNTTYTPTLTLANVTLPANYVWNAPSTALDVSKSGTAFAATYTDPSGNYNPATGSITVNVAKATGTFGTPAALNTTYTSTLTLANVTLPANYAWTTPTTALSAGNGQTFPATYTDPSGNYNAATGSITVNVAKANQAALSISSPATHTFGTAYALAATGGSGTGAITYAKTGGTGEGTISGSTLAISKAGTFTITATKAGDDNYNSATSSAFTITVSKATDLTATAPPTFIISYSNTNPNTFNLSYIALNKTASDHGALSYTLGTFTNVDGLLAAQPALSGTTLTYTGTGKESGNAMLVIDIESDNYANITVTLTFEATVKTAVAIGGLAAQDYTYDGTPKRGVSGDATSGDYEGALEYLYAGTGIDGIATEPPINVGEYRLIVRVPSSNDDYTGYAIYEFTIDKAKIAKPTAASNLAYTGAEQTGIAANAAYTITNGTATNAGNYAATVALKDTDNTEWEDGTDSDLELAWTIAKATPATPAGLTATAGQTLADVSLAAFTGWAWASALTTPVGTAGTQKHKANYTPTDAANYNALAGVDVNVAVSKVKITKPTVTSVSLVYTGAAQSAGIAANAAYTVTGGSATNAGSHTATVALKDTDNTEWEDGTDSDLELAWAIAKATPTTPAGLTATAGQTLANVTLPADWSWATPTASVGTAGTQTHKANYTPSDTANYNALANIEVTITVNAAVPIFVPQIAAGSIRVQATANAIILENLPINAKVEIYTLQGKRIYSAYPGNPKILKIGVQTKGIYVVKAGSQSARAVVR